MTKVRQQLLEVMRTVYNEWKLNPEKTAFKLSTKKLKHCPDHDAILRKLAEQYKVITIEQRPDPQDMGEADHGMYASENPREYERYMSYYILVNPTFEAFYQKHYSDNKVNVPSLNTKNFWVVIDAAEQIDDKANISPADTVIINANQTGSYIYNAPFKNLSYQEIAELKKSALEFLKGQNAVKSYEADVHVETDFGQDFDVIDSFKVHINRHVFDEVYEELKSQIEKHSGKAEEKAIAPEKNNIIFDLKGERLSNGEKSLNVGSATIEFYILKALFSVPVGQAVNTADIFEDWGGTEKGQTIYDAVSRLNKKFRQLLGTTSTDTKVVYQKSSKVYLDNKYSDSISTQK